MLNDILALKSLHPKCGMDDNRLVEIDDVVVMNGRVPCLKSKIVSREECKEACVLLEFTRIERNRKTKPVFEVFQMPQIYTMYLVYLITNKNIN